MPVELNKKFVVLLVIVLLIGAGFLFLFFQLYQNDINALTDFSVAYERFDQAISDYSGPVVASNLAGAPARDNFERKADQALAELTSKASTRISSLIKNDAELMRTTIEIADLSGNELEALKAYNRAAASKAANLDQAAKVFADLTLQRQAAYAHFLDLAGQNN